MDKKKQFKELLEQLDKSKDAFESYLITKDIMSIQETGKMKEQQSEHTILAPRHYIVVQDPQPVKISEMIQMVWSAAREKKEDGTNKFELVEREGGLYLNENT